MRRALLAVVAVAGLTTLTGRADEVWPPPEHANVRAIKDRFAHASRDPLGSPEDIAAIKQTILAAMNHPDSEIQEIRWLSPELAMVSTLRYEAGGWIFVIEKRQDKWIILVRYLTRIF